MTLATVSPYERERISVVGDRAIVLGASMAGLLAARVLADAFERVTIVERDPLPDEPDARRSVPQARHVHVLLEAGRATLEDLFPGISEELLSAGGVMIDAATDMKHFEEGGFLAAGPEPLSLYCASRPLFELIVRRRVASLDTVTLSPGRQFRSYRFDGPATVTGVVASGIDGERTAFDGDLVVDATGRTSRTPGLLKERGYTPPAVEEVQIDVTYSTVFVERPPDDQRGFLVPPSHPRTRGAAVVPIENDRWQVTMIGVHGDSPPADVEGFNAFAGSLPVSELEHLLDGHAWISDTPARYPFPANVRRRYDDLDRFPARLVVTGDALASFNPIYGQGMSVAALEAVALHHTLATDGFGIGSDFFDRAAAIVDLVWRIAVGADFAFPKTTGPKPRGTALFNWYLSRLIRRAHTDGVLAKKFYRVLRLERSSSTLFAPAVLRRVFLRRTR